MDATPDGGFKIRSRMLIFKDGVATALCPTCKEPVVVPVVVNAAVEPISGPKLVVKI